MQSSKQAKSHRAGPTGVDGSKSSRSHLGGPAVPLVDQNEHLNSVEANSGAAFARKLGLKIDPKLAPKLNMFAWNLGLRHQSQLPSISLSSVGATLSIVDIIPLDEMKFLTAVYFEKIDPYYPFLDRKEISHRITETWVPSTSVAPVPFTPYEGILCGVAALGSLFSRRESNNTENQLLETARAILESHLCFHAPSIDLITAWVLRVSYLRIAGIPHLAWIASCTLMHLMEASGLHMELPANSILAQNSDDISLETRRKLFGIARHFNLWFSFELGRTRVTFPTATTKLPEPSDNGNKDIFSFLALSESLDPEQSQDIPALEQVLLEIMNIDDLQPPMILTQCNLMLCVNRRLQSLNVTIAGGMFDKFLGVARQGLRVSQEMVLSHCPWHTVANVPFQIVCALLSIDNHASISLLPGALKVLQEVTISYDTEVMREARNTAFSLVRFQQRRKEQEAKLLNDIVQTALPEGDSSGIQPSDTLTEPNLVDQSNGFWLDSSILDFQGFQLDPLLMVDGPWPKSPFPTT